MTRVAVPRERPKLLREDVMAILSTWSNDWKMFPVVVLGIRGYYKKTLGKPDVNDRGIYDDAIFVVSDRVFKSFNANTDASVERLETKDKKGMAMLCAERMYHAHILDYHKGQYLALCQRVGPVTVERDGGSTESGYFGINIHMGGHTSTSSEGCQTIHPEQWQEFITLVKAEMKRCFGALYDTKVVPYVLIEN